MWRKFLAWSYDHVYFSWLKNRIWDWEMNIDARNPNSGLSKMAARAEREVIGKEKTKEIMDKYRDPLSRAWSAPGEDEAWRNL